MLVGRLLLSLGFHQFPSLYAKLTSCCQQSSSPHLTVGEDANIELFLQNDLLGKGCWINSNSYSLDRQSAR